MYIYIITDRAPKTYVHSLTTGEIMEAGRKYFFSITVSLWMNGFCKVSCRFK